MFDILAEMSQFIFEEFAQAYPDSLFLRDFQSFNETENGQDALGAIPEKPNIQFSSISRSFFSDFFNPVVQEEQVQNKKEVEKFDIHIMDKDYAPLSQHCVRALCDKMYDKRKAAALEIEK